jgi:hypothetical protein
MEFLYQLLAAIGGIGVIVIGLSKFLGGIWRDHIKEQDRKKTELQLESTRQRYGVRRAQAGRFVESQYNIYLELWEALQALGLTVDALWHKATRDNAAALSRELWDVRNKVKKWSLFFEDSHLEELLQLLKVLERFWIGKEGIIKIRLREEVSNYHLSEIEKQIELNKQYKVQFDSFLETLRRSFRDRLSKIDYDDVSL